MAEASYAPIINLVMHHTLPPGCDDIHSLSFWVRNEGLEMLLDWVNQLDEDFFMEDRPPALELTDQRVPLSKRRGKISISQACGQSKPRIPSPIIPNAASARFSSDRDNTVPPALLKFVKSRPSLAEGFAPAAARRRSQVYSIVSEPPPTGIAGYRFSLMSSLADQSEVITGQYGWLFQKLHQEQGFYPPEQKRTGNAAEVKQYAATRYCTANQMMIERIESFKMRRKHAGQVFAILLLLYYVTWLPYKVSFFSNISAATKVVDTVLDLCWLVFMYLSAISPYEDKGSLVLEANRIKRAYLISWEFHIDLLGCIPFQLITLIVSGAKWDACRLNRLFLILRWNGLIKSVMGTVGASSLGIRITLIASTYLFIVHIISCALRYVVGHDPEEGIAWFQQDISKQNSVFEYTVLFDWSFRMLSGYDAHPHPKTNFHMAVALPAAVLGFSYYTILVANAVSLVEALDKHNARLLIKLDEVRDSLSYMAIPQSFQEEVAAYYRKSWSLFRNFSEQEVTDVFDDLEDDLKEAMRMFLAKQMILSISLFTNVADNEQFVSSMIPRLKITCAMPGQQILGAHDEPRMYFIMKGWVVELDEDEIPRMEHHEGSCFGVRTLLFGGKPEHIVARDFCHLCMVTRKDFDSIASCFPEALFGILERFGDNFASPKVRSEHQKSELSDVASEPPTGCDTDSSNSSIVSRLAGAYLAAREQVPGEGEESINNSPSTEVSKCFGSIDCTALLSPRHHNNHRGFSFI